MGVRPRDSGVKETSGSLAGLLFMRREGCTCLLCFSLAVNSIFVGALWFLKQAKSSSMSPALLNGQLPTRKGAGEKWGQLLGPEMLLLEPSKE